MAVTHPTTIRNVLADAIDTQTGGTGFLVVGTAGMAADLVRLPMSATAFGDASGGDITANAITTTNAIATGTAAEFEVRDGATGNIIFAGTCTATGGGGDIEITNTSIATNDPISVTSLVYSAPA